MLTVTYLCAPRAEEWTQMAKLEKKPNPKPRAARKSNNEVQRTRGGWTPAGTAAARRAVHSERGNERGQRTRQTILDAARQVFEREGYVNTNVEAIVAEADVARGSFYTYFTSKADIFRELSGEVTAKVDQAVSRTDGDHLDPIDALARANHRYVEVYRANAAIQGVIEQIATMDSAVHEVRLRAQQKHVKRVAATIQSWQARGVADETVDAVTTAAALVAMTSNFCYWWFVGPETFDEEQALETLNDIWVRAVGLRRRPRRKITNS
jgi:AcrR family transcriptional regulator